MRAELNHTIVWCRDKVRSSRFLVELLALGEPRVFGPMLVVELANGVSLDYYDHEPPIASQHYAFLIGEGDFDAVYGRIRARGLEHWADPGRHRAQEIYHHNGGRGVYFADPDGHLLEVMTRPYEGSGTGATAAASA